MKVTSQLKKELLKPTKIYTKEILELTSRNLINAAVHVTGGGLIENIIRSVPDNFSANLDLSKIRPQQVFKWLKSKNISDIEMLKTFNCGVGFCIIIDKKNLHKIKRYFKKEFKPYEIGYISKNKNKLNLLNSIKW